MTNSNIKTAVVTGNHEYDVLNFQHLFRELPGIDGYVQSLEDFATDPLGGWKRYDAVVFFNYHQDTPGTVGGELDDAVAVSLSELATSDTGIVLLHHAILCYPQWDVWEGLSGIPTRGAAGSAADQTLRIDPTDTDHPITSGLAPWDMIDEYYAGVEVGDDNNVLLTTDHPESMKIIGWTRDRPGGRTFCFQSGHDDQTWTNPTFRTVLERGVKWTVGQL